MLLILEMKYASHGLDKDTFLYPFMPYSGKFTDYRVKYRPNMWLPWHFVNFHDFSRCITGVNFQLLALKDPEALQG